MVSLSVSYHPALLHRQTLILDRLLTVLVVFSTVVLIPPFLDQSLSLYSHLISLARVYLVEFDHSVFGGGNIGKCSRLRQPSWLLGAH